jgi:hypothetical protein
MPVKNNTGVLMFLNGLCNGFHRPFGNKCFSPSVSKDTVIEIEKRLLFDRFDKFLV